jgi:hypothetical protein
MQSVQSIQPVYSAYGSDPNLAELVSIFVHELPQRLETLRSHSEVADWESISRVAHQLNELCCCETSSPGEILKALDRFAEHCERVRPGSAELN